MHATSGHSRRAHLRRPRKRLRRVGPELAENERGQRGRSQAPRGSQKSLQWYSSTGCCTASVVLCGVRLEDGRDARCVPSFSCSRVVESMCVIQMCVCVCSGGSELPPRGRVVGGCYCICAVYVQRTYRICDLSCAVPVGLCLQGPRPGTCSGPLQALVHWLRGICPLCTEWSMLCTALS